MAKVKRRKSKAMEMDMAEAEMPTLSQAIEMREMSREVAGIPAQATTAFSPSIPSQAAMRAEMGGVGTNMDARLGGVGTNMDARLGGVGTNMDARLGSLSDRGESMPERKAPARKKVSRKAAPQRQEAKKSSPAKKKAMVKRSGFRPAMVFRDEE